ncbi:MAG: HepT-like ribonuclease domain-containing protein [Thermoanaerobaculia bacterium]
MSPIADRLVELRRHLEHLKSLRPRVHGASDLGRDLTLHNDVLFPLLMVCQAVIDVAAELSARRGEKFEDFRGAIRNLALDPLYSPEVVRALERLPGFRTVLVHDYADLDMDRVVEALHDLSAIEHFLLVTANTEKA